MFGSASVDAGAPDRGSDMASPSFVVSTDPASSLASNYNVEPIPSSTGNSNNINNINNIDDDDGQQPAQQLPQMPQRPQMPKQQLAVPGFFHPPSRNTAVLWWTVDQARHHESYSRPPDFNEEVDHPSSPSSLAVAVQVARAGEMAGDDGQAVVDATFAPAPVALAAPADTSAPFSDFDDLQDAEGEDDVDLINVGNNGPSCEQGYTRGEWTLIEKEDAA